MAVKTRRRSDGEDVLGQADDSFRAGGNVARRTDGRTSSRGRYGCRSRRPARSTSTGSPPKLESIDADVLIPPAAPGEHPDRGEAGVGPALSWPDPPDRLAELPRSRSGGG